jgi:very-short-patch-repair endonuclease
VPHPSSGAAKCRSSFEQVAHPIAVRQHGVVARSQLLDAGIPSHLIDRHLRQGRLDALHRGVYGIGPILPPRAREMAACLACGPRAVISHGSAAGLWGILAPVPKGAAIEVAVRQGHHVRPGIIVHRLSTLRDDECTRTDGVPVSTPARTLLDLAVAAPHRTIERALDEAVARRLVTPAKMRCILERHAGRPGTRRLRAVLDRDHPAFTRSEAEERFLELVRGAHLSPPERNVLVGRHQVDVLWRAERLVVEIDGYAFHSSRRAFERDRLRDRELAGHGYRVIRVTWRHLVNEPLRLLVQLVKALEAK